MKPALLSFPHVSSYPVLMLLGFFFGWILARRRAFFYAINPQKIDSLCLILPITGLLGARLFARLFYARLPLSEALKVWEGDGLVFYGGFLFSVAAVLIFAWIRRIRLVALCDCLAPAVAVGLALGRIGCFLGGCCWGDLCASQTVLNKVEPAVASQIQTVPLISSPSWPFAVQFPRGSDPFKQQVKLGLIQPETPASLPVHPVQLYEAILAFALCVILHKRFQGYHKPGSAALALLAGYAAIRFGTEFLRADNKSYAMGLTFSQIVSIEILLFCCGAWLLRAFARPRVTAKERTPPLAEQAGL